MLLYLLFISSPFGERQNLLKLIQVVRIEPKISTQSTLFFQWFTAFSIEIELKVSTRLKYLLQVGSWETLDVSGTFCQGWKIKSVPSDSPWLMDIIRHHRGFNNFLSMNRTGLTSYRLMKICKQPFVGLLHLLSYNMKTHS